jgi:hypothetical protein
MARNINATSEAALKQWESFIPFVYDDADGKPGLKKTRLRPGMKVRGTATQATAILDRTSTPGHRTSPKSKPSSGFVVTSIRASVRSKLR